MERVKRARFKGSEKFVVGHRSSGRTIEN